MSGLRLAGLLASLPVAAALFVLLWVCATIDVQATGDLLLGAPLLDVAAIVLLMGFNSFLAGEKWRLVLAWLNQGQTRDPPRSICFALSAIGVAFGQLLPAQLSIPLCRWVGIRSCGTGAVTRGVGATLFEQFFDLLVAGLMAVASLLVICFGGDAVLWWPAAAVGIGAGFTCCRRGGPLIGRIVNRLTRRVSYRRLTELGARVGSVDFLGSRLTRQLFALSLVRFAVLVVVSAVSADAIRVNIPLWQLAAAFPFAMLGTALALTPGGLGVAEWSLASVLFALGTPFPVAAQIAVASRILSAGAALVGGIVGFLVIRLARRNSRPLTAAT